MTTDPSERCRYCDRRFATRERRALHAGREHPERLSAAERAAFDDARETERAALRRHKLRLLLVLVVIYFCFLFAYAAFAAV